MTNGWAAKTENTPEPSTEASRTSLTPYDMFVLENLGHHQPMPLVFLRHPDLHIKRKCQRRQNTIISSISAIIVIVCHEHQLTLQSTCRLPIQGQPQSVTSPLVARDMRHTRGRYNPIVPSIPPIAPIEWRPSPHIVDHASKQLELPPSALSSRMSRSSSAWSAESPWAIFAARGVQWSEEGTMDMPLSVWLLSGRVPVVMQCDAASTLGAVALSAVVQSLSRHDGIGLIEAQEVRLRMIEKDDPCMEDLIYHMRTSDRSLYGQRT